MIDQSGDEVDVLETTHQYHAYEAIKDGSINLEEYDALISVGGDGIIVEIVKVCIVCLIK